MSFLRDLIESALPVAYAEEQPEEDNEVEESSEGQEEQGGEESGDSEEGSEEEAKEEGGEGDEDEDEDEDDEDEDDDEDEEGGDPFDELRAECQNSAACKPYVHHFEECVERVTKAQESEDYEQSEWKEDCVEEFFHLQHCINDCAAPRLFYKLK
ncbi:Piso0_003806 [Millerozyma farinosa CBS 7064]|uniref:Cytochrome b-c1 complex subunit 6, mitochondrial n=1 Tax=Pichia sorbitophila (strain ATCC MYA-4447 / BCRC 22081 / CBS 7064 / NBRC 10061 / NRRL Y-12695) TaxID=559304 RepID=G8Y8C8_PICSO|nr:Piso0_003806 [Millerozyma farinosa CBS 7064]CCE84265.1 Piso0_003806 [Millerozyma farinosa CBS 7064]